MLNPNSSKPLYEQIREYLLLNIQSGVFPPHSRIPSERELAEQFHVSRLTASKAIKELVQAGMLYVRIGKGTFISPQKIDQTLDTLTSFTEDMSARGHFTSSKVLHASIQTATPEIATHLNIVPGVRIVVLCRVRMADDKPVALENAMLVEACCPQLLNGHDFGRESLYKVLREQYHLHLTHAEQTIEARQATAEEAAALDIQPGSPVLAITRVTYTSDNRPVEYVLSAYRGDRYKLRAILRHI